MPALHRGWAEVENRVGTTLTLIRSWPLMGCARLLLEGGRGSHVEEWFLLGMPHSLSES